MLRLAGLLVFVALTRGCAQLDAESDP